MKDENLSVIREDGKPLNKPVKRSIAHSEGVWHRSISVFVINPNGEILIERRSEHKDLFPGFYDILGGHVEFGQHPLNCAINEISEEISLDIKPERLEALCDEDEVIEHVVIPEKHIRNFERKTIYLLLINAEEEARILKQSSALSKLAPQELIARGPEGEVSHIEFWPWEELYQAIQPHNKYELASGTHSALSLKKVRDKVNNCCLTIRNNKRNDFLNKYSLFEKLDLSDDLLDKYLYDLFYPQPTKKADNSVVSEIFEDGQKQQAGAYLIGEGRKQFAGDSYWEAKYNDPKDRYVDNFLNAISYDLSKKKRNALNKTAPEIKEFVSELMELPLANGRRFRDSFGNLVDISIARAAVLRWLENKNIFIDKKQFDFPTRNITTGCLEAGYKFFDRNVDGLTQKNIEKLHELVKFGLNASSADFNNPAFQRRLRKAESTSNLISLFDNATIQDLDFGLGGAKFLKDFYLNFIENSPPVNIVYLPGSVSQACFSLAISQEILSQNQNAKITFIPKTGHPGNDLSYDETIQLLKRKSDTHFKKISYYQKDKRFLILDKGPMTHGLDPNGLDKVVAIAISQADVLIAEGQAYAELRCWKKPVYISFRVNGRIANAIHGPSLSEKTGFVRLTPGVKHFNVFDASDSNGTGKLTQSNLTTADYVKAILHDNLTQIAKYIFHNDLKTAILIVNAEAKRLNKNFIEIIIGNASKPPDTIAVKKFKERHYPIFACGGGGGFSAVTLKALRQLGIQTVAGLPSTDDGGSTGELQQALKPLRGFVFGVGDMASAIQDSLDNKGKESILSYRFADEPVSTVQGVIMRIVEEIKSPSSTLSSAVDFLSFVCDQLNFARIIDQKFKLNQKSNFSIEGASIRNLNVIAAYELCNALGDSAKISQKQRIAALIVLERALALSENLITLPVTFDECKLYLDYDRAFSKKTLSRLPNRAFGLEENRIYGQQYIDKLSHPGKRKMVGVIGKGNRLPNASKEYIRRMKEAEVIIMGAGSLISSQLSQFVIPGVIDILLEAKNKRRILVLNHVNMDETLGMSVKDQIRLIEDVAAKMCDTSKQSKLNRRLSKIRISDIFSDIVVPRTVASEIEKEMSKLNYKWVKPKPGISDFIKLRYSDNKKNRRVYRNKYVDFLEKHPEVVSKYKITAREIEILSFLDQPQELYKKRSETGRYRGALFATKKDIAYLTKQGVQRRNIHEVDSIGINKKSIKAKGIQDFEYFPGLIPQSLMGIFQLALEKGMTIF